MKVKKESVLLVLVIVALSAYLVMRKSERTHYELPQIASIKTSEFSKVEINSGDRTILLSKADDDHWKLLPEGFPADQSKIDGMLDTIGALTVTALISESENYNRYDLDGEKKIVVKAWGGDTVKREFEIGKAAPSFQHTFVKLVGDDRVYQAVGNFRTRFEQTVDGLRDKAVLSFEPNEIHEIHIVKDGKELTFARVEESAVTPGEQAEPQKSGVKEAKTVWKTADGKEGDETELKRIVNALSSLRCDRFIADQKKEDLKEPTHTFALKGAQEYRLSLFAKRENDEKMSPATTSANEYPFLLPEWQVNNLTKKLDSLVKEVKKEGANSELSKPGQAAGPRP